MTGRADGDPGFEAVIVAGGRGSRLGGVAKPLLEHAGGTLLGHALDAAAGAARTAVVGPGDLAPAVPAGRALLTREDPPFGGPAAAVAAGLDALAAARAPGASPAPLVLVLAADLVHPGPAVRRVLEAARAGYRDDAAWVPVDGSGRLQPLCCAVAAPALAGAVADARERGGIEHASMMRLLAMVHMVRLPMPDTAFDDVDTWEDAGRAGIARPDPDGRDGRPGG